MYQCRICRSEGDHARVTARETMYGWAESFEYFQCARCGCLQIAQIPADLERYYGEHYYSFTQRPEPTGIKRLLYIQRDRYAFTNRGAIGRWIYQRFPRTDYRFLSRLPLQTDDRVLDVGCGVGLLLQSLSRAGFTRLSGVDPFIDSDIRYPSGVQIRKLTLDRAEETQDLIMFNHSLEHMPEQQAVMQSAARLLSERGVIVVRIPIVSSYAWSHYGVDWVQLDAPRHLFLHSADSIRLVGESVGLELFDTYYDSSALQFWGSEQLRGGIPLASPKSHAIDRRQSIFSDAQIATYERQAAILNSKMQGDQAAFYFRRAAT